MAWRLVVAVFFLAGTGCSSPPREEREPEKTSVLFVTIDTLRADRLGCYGDAPARTPNLDRLAATGTRFGRAFAAAPITLPSHATLFTGLLPPSHGVRGNGSFVLGDRHPTLAEAFRRHGYATAAFVGAMPLHHRYGLNRGFDVYDDRFDRRPGVHFEFAERRAADVTSAAQAWLSSRTGAVFLWVHYFDPHAPYDPPPAFQNADAYRGEIASVDAALGDLLGSWKRRPGGSIVAVAADHGEAFGEHRERSHSLFVYETTLRVPLIFAGAGVPAGHVIERPVGLEHAAATLLRLARIDGANVPGTNLFDSDAQESALYAETLAPRLDFGWADLRAWRRGGYKLIRAPKPELYDIERDPEESKNIYATDAATASRLSRELADYLARSGEVESVAPAQAVDTEALRSLGYVQGPGGRGSGADPKDKVDVARAIGEATGPFPDAAAAIATYRRLVRLDPPNPLLNQRLADALLRAGREQEALPYFRTVARAGPRSADPFVGLATALANLGRLGEAKKALEDALAVDPRSGQAHYNLGELARLAGDLAAARRHYEAALGDEATRTAAQARLAVAGEKGPP